MSLEWYVPRREEEKILPRIYLKLCFSMSFKQCFGELFQLQIRMLSFELYGIIVICKAVSLELLNIGTQHTFVFHRLDYTATSNQLIIESL